MKNQMKVFKFQKKALSQLVKHSTKALVTRKKTHLLLKAPTGSGKTIITGYYIEKMMENRENISFVWVCETPNLTIQSRDKFSQFFNFRTYLFEDTRREKTLLPNTITFVNWEILKENTKGTITGETTTSLVDLCERSQKEENRRIVFIIDEAHTNANSIQSRDIVARANPDIVLDVTATPNKKRVEMFAPKMIEIRMEDVQKEELVKSSIVINQGQSLYNDPGFRKQNQLSTFKDFILYQSLEMRERMEKQIYTNFEKEGEPEKAYVPMLLIQIPASSKNDGDYLPPVEEFLQQRGYRKDEDYAIYMSEYVTDKLINIGEDEKYKVLIFKNAIAKGWDCPRASILTMLRDPKSESFTIQTIGRIMRVPNQKYFTGRNVWLNKGYVFVETEDNKILNDYQKDVQAEGYSAIQNPIKKMFEKQNFLVPTLKWEIERRSNAQILKMVRNELIEDVVHSNILRQKRIDLFEFTKRNNTGEYRFIGDEDGLEISEKEEIVLTEADRINRYKKASQKSKIEKNILLYIKSYLEDEFENDEAIVCDILYHHLEILEKKYEELKNRFSKPQGGEKIQVDWYPETLREEKDGFEKPEFGKNYFYEKCFGKFSSLEERLARALDESKNIDFWIRNKSEGATALKVPYQHENHFLEFCPDFIFRVKNTIWIIDTKLNRGDAGAKEKYEALKALEKHYDNVKVAFVSEFKDDKDLYIFTKETYEKENRDKKFWDKLEL